MANEESSDELEVSLQSDLDLLRRIQAQIGQVMLFALQASGASLWARMYLSGRKPYNLRMLLASLIEGLEDNLRTSISSDQDDS